MATANFLIKYDTIGSDHTTFDIKDCNGVVIATATKAELLAGFTVTLDTSCATVEVVATGSCVVTDTLTMAKFEGTGTISSTFSGGEAAMVDKASSTTVAINAKLDTYKNSSCPLPSTGTLEIKFKYTPVSGSLLPAQDWYTLDTQSVNFTAIGASVSLTSDFRDYLVGKSSGSGIFVDTHTPGTANDVMELAGATVDLQYIWTNSCGEVITSNIDEFVMPMERAGLYAVGMATGLSGTFNVGEKSIMMGDNSIATILASNPDMITFSSNTTVDILAAYGQRWDSFSFNGVPVSVLFHDVDGQGTRIDKSVKEAYNSYLEYVNGTELVNRNTSFTIIRKELFIGEILNDSLIDVEMDFDWKPSDNGSYVNSTIYGYDLKQLSQTVSFPLDSTWYASKTYTGVYNGNFGFTMPMQYHIANGTWYGLPIKETSTIPATW